MTERRCKICGGPISAANKTGFCMKSPVCTQAGRRANKLIRLAVERGRRADLVARREVTRGPVRRPRGEVGDWHTPWESPVSPLVAPGAIVRMRQGD